MTALGSGRSLGGYARLMRLDRPVGTLLLLWPTLAALWMAAEGPPPPGILAIFVAGTFLARSAGCVANDIADRNFDGRVERTRRRPLPQGEVSLAEALALFALLGGAALGVALGGPRRYVDRLAPHPWIGGGRPQVGPNDIAAARDLHGLAVALMTLAVAVACAVRLLQGDA